MQNISQSAPGILIRNGTIITTDGRLIKDIRIVGEKIVDIDDNLIPAGKDERQIDATGLYIFPGGIDPHVHLTLPGSVPADDRWVDDLTSGSKAALAGGITTIGNISFPDFGETPLATLRREIKLVRQQAICDIFLHPVIMYPALAVIEDLDKMAKAGHTTIKIFMVTKQFDQNISVFSEIIEAAGEAGMLTMLHCEDDSLIQTATMKLMAAGKGSLCYYADSRPVESEVVATKKAIEICAATNAPIYIVHLSCEQALRVCQQAQVKALPVYVETRPLYLHLSRERYLDEDGPLYVGQPPLRETSDIEALWQGLTAGSIHTLATDHAPWTKQQKLDPSLNIVNLRPGVNNLQVMLPMLFSEGVLKDRISIEQFVAVASTNAAKIFGIFPQKGTIAVGSDADLVIWDPHEIRLIRDEDQFSNAGFSIYSGRKVTGWPVKTIRRGAIAYENGKIYGEPGSGRLIKCEKHQ